jgi:hypothetical protein
VVAAYKNFGLKDMGKPLKQKLREIELPPIEGA